MKAFLQRNKIYILAFFYAFAITLLAFISMGCLAGLTTDPEHYTLGIGWISGMIYVFAYWFYTHTHAEGLMTRFNESIEALYKHVGFKPDWVVYPIDDCTECYWATDGKFVRYAETLEKFNSQDEFYQDIVYTQRFYKQHVYRGKNFTMIFCDPRVDCVQWFRVFSNKKEQRNCNITPTNFV